MSWRRFDNPLASPCGARVRYTLVIMNSGVASMRAWTLPMVIVVVGAAIGGCGQKGPLYRDNPEASSGPVEQAASAGKQNERPDDRGSNAK